MSIKKSLVKLNMKKENELVEAKSKWQLTVIC